MTIEPAARPPVPAGSHPGMQHPRQHWRTIALIGGTSVAAVALWHRGLGLDLWLDEILTLSVAQHPIPEILRLLELDGSPPLYYLIAHGWQAVFGTSEVTIRMLPFLIGLLAAVLGAMALARSESFPVGFTFGALAVATPGLLYYSTEGRQYSLLFAVGLCCAVLLRDEIEEPLPRRRLLLAGALALACYTHNWGLFLWLGTMTALLAAGTPPLRDRAVTVAQVSGLTAVLFAPWLVVLLRQTSSTGAPWLAPPGSVDAVLDDLAWLFGTREYVLIALAAIVVGRFVVGRRSYDALLVQTVATVASGWAFSMLVTPAFTHRYLMVALPGVLLMLSLAAASHRYLATVVVSLVVLMAVYSAVILSGRPHDYKSRAVEIALAIDDHRSSGEQVTVVAADTSLPPVAYYLAEDLPTPVHFITFRGVVEDPTIVDWRDSADAMRAWRPEQALNQVVPQSDVVVFLAERASPPEDRMTDYWRAYEDALDRAAIALDADPRLVLTEEYSVTEWDVRIYQVDP